MVATFVDEHYIQWEKVREDEGNKLKEKFGQLYPNSERFVGYKPGHSLSLQSFVTSDLLFDFISLARLIENGGAFKREIWIRSCGTQLITGVESVSDNRAVWNDILGKILIEFDGNNPVTAEWFQDGDCRVNNILITDDSEVKQKSFSYMVK